jgi:hypothetical protein
MCDRRWGSKTQIRKWGNGKISYRQLYKTLAEYDNLIGFWRRSGQGNNAGSLSPPPILFFEWGSSFISGSRVSPTNSGTYNVVKSPFMWISISSDGNNVSFLDLDRRLDFPDDLITSGELGFSENDLVPINLSFMGNSHVVVEENPNFGPLNSSEIKKSGMRRISSGGNIRADEFGNIDDPTGSDSGSPGSLPDRLMSDLYQYFANRTSPAGDRSSRRQRRREKERQWRKKWEPEHFVKIVNCSPTPLRPLQGLWKGICDDMKLDFFLVAYDDIGGIACRRVGDPSKPFSGYAPVFWTSNTTFIESPFSPDEDYIYESRLHIRPRVDDTDQICKDESVSRILNINSSYDLVIPDLAGTTVNPRHVEGRIWQYENGAFGFGFLRDNYIIDLKHIAQNGCLLDTVQLCNG